MRPAFLFVRLCGNRFLRNNGDVRAELQSADEVWRLLFHELHYAGLDSVKREIRSQTDILAHVEFGAALANDNFTRLHELSIAAFDAQALGLRISAVSGGALS